MNIESSLQQTIGQAFKELFGAELPLQDINLQATRKDFEGSHTFVTFPFAKLSKKNPQETARLIGEYLQQHTQLVSAFNVVQGFLNLTIADSAWLQVFADIVTQADFGFYASNGQKVMVEYSSPNTNKPLHLGHLRNNFLGYSVAEILKANGYDVIKTNLVNDRGIHICKSMLAYQKFGNGETPETSGMKGDHLIGKYYVLFDKAYKQEIDALKAQGMAEEEAKKTAPLMQEAQQMLVKWEEGDKETVELWQRLNTWVYTGFAQTYTRMGVDFDKMYYESNVYLLGKDIVEEGLAKGVFFKKENGSVWIDLSAEGLDEKLVLRADGTSVYITQDLGTADIKYKDFGMEKSIYVVGNEQDYHFNVLFTILKKLGKPYADGLYHLSYGMVDLPTGRMKSREGTVVDADDLMEEMVQTATARSQELGKIEEFSEEGARVLYEMLGIGALKYFLLKVDPKKRMLFNPDEAIELHGHTATFIQYTHARISTILRKADLMDVKREVNIQKLQPAEKDVIALLATFPDRVKEAGRDYAPSVISQYAYDLAKEYNRFFAEVSIFNADTAEETAFRVVLSEQVGKTIRKAMSLLGISVPERM
ncbi:arginine--tRNA ligase [Rhodocytophaga aerolata]|uniref:Arginine--tRNA ligase n=1 Tax=Rhodocytophaga aerolata TaxID=455078 RepID=A0ABT8R4Z9_9BACT|nr:arginine--tRNA ligase [Rhodocytophaga aerolata]MDO1447170.1 arginine--tRNA ligase [Rhodocytophaga aerolata]